VLAVERRTYPTELQEPAELIEERLRFEDVHYSSLNLGLFDDERLTGYLLAHVDDGTEFPGSSVAENVYVADIAVLPGYRRHLGRLILAFGREVRFEYPGLPVVAHTIDSTEDMWRRHDAMFRRYGYRMSQTAQPGTTRAGHPVSLVVWKPDATGRVAAAVARAEPFRNRVAVATSSGRPLATCVIGDEDGLRQLRDQWQTLEGSIPGLPVFQTFDYQAAWVRSFGHERRLMIVCVLDGDQLLGIAPFQVSLVRLHGRLHRQLSFLGAPWEVDRPRFLFARDERDCAEAAARTLLARRDQWDLVWFHEQDATDPALATFCAALEGGGVLHGRVPSSHCPCLVLEGTWQQFLATKSQKFRKNLKAARRKLEAAGRLEYDGVAGDAARLQELFGEYELLESRSWKAKDAVGVSQSVEHLRFYRHLIDAFGDSGRFVFRCLRLDGRLVAATFGLRHGRTFHSLHIAHDAAYARSSPGTLLEALELEECFGTDLVEYDPLGGFLKNKVRWATRMRDTVEVHLYQRQPRLVAAYVFYFCIKPPLKRFLARIGVRWPGKPRTDRVEALA
jgi:CelD/BcsL family acetyltransferase involved in cellulose biosynthesis